MARPEAKKPKVMIVIDEKVAGVFGTTGFENVGQAESTLIDRFIKAGFPVVDSQTIRRNLPRDKALRLLEGDQKAAAVAGLQFGAQVVITGNAISKNAGGKLAGTNMQSLQATVQVRAVRTDDGQIITSQSAQGTQAHIDEVQGGAMAIQQAIRQLAGPLIADIRKVSLGQGSLATQEIKLVISGLVSYRHLMAVRNYLERGLQGVKSVNMRHFTQGTAELSVNYAGESIAIADKLAYQKFRGFRLEPTIPVCTSSCSFIISERADRSTIMNRWVLNSSVVRISDSPSPIFQLSFGMASDLTAFLIPMTASRFLRPINAGSKSVFICSEAVEGVSTLVFFSTEAVGEVLFFFLHSRASSTSSLSASSGPSGSIAKAVVGDHTVRRKTVAIPNSIPFKAWKISLRFIANDLLTYLP